MKRVFDGVNKSEENNTTNLIAGGGSCSCTCGSGNDLKTVLLNAAIAAVSGVIKQ